jgi:hypothetical protein
MKLERLSSLPVTTPSTLLEELVDRTRLTWPQVAVAVGEAVIYYWWRVPIIQ